MNKLERFLSKDLSSPISIIGFFILAFALIIGIIFLTVNYPLILLVFTPAVLYPVYRFLKDFWDA